MTIPFRQSTSKLSGGSPPRADSLRWQLGRPVPMVERFISQLGITTPCVLFNGGMIYDPVDKRPLWYTEIPLEAKKLALQVMEDFKDAPGGVPGIEIFAPDMIYLLNWHPYMQWHLVDRYPIPHQKATFSEIEHLPWVKFMFVCDEKIYGEFDKVSGQTPGGWCTIS